MTTTSPSESVMERQGKLSKDEWKKIEGFGTPQAQERLTSQLSGHPMKRILIVDDEPTTVFLLKVRLAQSDYEIIVAEDGEQGYLKAKEERPDLIILDVMLPSMGGFEVCSKLKKDTEARKIPIIILSARCGDVDEKMGLECGGDAYFGKPCDVKSLLQKISALLDGQKD